MNIRNTPFYVKGFPELLNLAGAKIQHGVDCRDFLLGCVGRRRDGAIVHSNNGAYRSEMPFVTNSYQLPTVHAEGRVLRKLDSGGEIYVARLSKKTGMFAMARPCGMCQVLIQSKKCKKVYYSINATQYGVWYPDRDVDVVFSV